MSLFKASKKEIIQKGSASSATTSVGSRNATKLTDLVVLKPSFSEKANSMGRDNKYVFFVSKDSNRHLIKNDIENRYNVNVVRVNIINTQGKTKRWLNRSDKRASSKKAIVTLKAGDRIDIA